VRQLEDRIRDLERLLGHKTFEVEILQEALAKSESSVYSPEASAVVRQKVLEVHALIPSSPKAECRKWGVPPTCCGGGGIQ
jgi:hypothetical protein